MRDVKTMAAQGDVLFRRVAQVPDGFAPRTKPGPLIVAHSETGHHHTIETADGCGVTMFEGADPLVCYLQMNTDTVDFSVVHHRPYDTHETLRCLGRPGDVWEVRRQREWAPEGWRRVQD